MVLLHIMNQHSDSDNMNDKIVTVNTDGVVSGASITPEPIGG